MGGKARLDVGKAGLDYTGGQFAAYLERSGLNRLQAAEIGKRYTEAQQTVDWYIINLPHPAGVVSRLNHVQLSAALEKMLALYRAGNYISGVPRTIFSTAYRVMEDAVRSATPQTLVSTLKAHTGAQSVLKRNGTVLLPNSSFRDGHTLETSLSQSRA